MEEMQPREILEIVDSSLREFNEGMAHRENSASASADARPRSSASE